MADKSGKEVRWLMYHNFDTAIAEKYGVHAAILLNNIYFWIEKNKASDRNFYDGYYWTYSSNKAFSELFPYMTRRQIEYALKRLIDEGLLITGNYNDKPYDRTLWYAITKFGYSILQNCEMEVTKLLNGSNKIVEPIPYINTYINKDINNICASEEKKLDRSDRKVVKETNSDIEEFFEELWTLYPIKKGKGSVSKAQKQKLYRIGIEEMSRAVQRYVSEMERDNVEKKYWKHGSTFFNSGYVDYLDKNYTEVEKEAVKAPEEDITATSFYGRRFITMDD